MPSTVLAQLNIAKLLQPLESPQLKGFVDNLDRINAVAEQSKGFVWRLKSEDPDNANNAVLFGEDIIVNMSTWQSIEALHHFTYRSAHTEVLSRRKEWFSMLNTYSVLWWHPSAEPPTVAIAAKRLALLQESGPTEEAFTFKTAWPRPD